MQPRARRESLADLTAPILQKSSGVATLHRFLLFRPPVTLQTRSSFPARLPADGAEVFPADGSGVAAGSSSRLPCTDWFTESAEARCSLGRASLPGFFVGVAWRGFVARFETDAGFLVLPEFWRWADARLVSALGVVSWVPFRPVLRRCSRLVCPKRDRESDCGHG